MTDETPPSPPEPRPRGRLLAFAVLVLTFVAIAVGGLDQLRSRARRLHIVNGTPERVRVTIGDQTAEVPPGESRALHLPEGRHAASIATLGSSGAPRQEALSLTSDFLSRHLAREVFVLNVDGAAALIREEARPDGGSTRFLFGTFIKARGIDFPFQPFPKKLRGAAQVRLGIADDPPARILAAAGAEDIGAALAWAERRLDPTRVDEPLLAAYARRAAASDPARAVAFLSAGLDRRPVHVPWHRAYQTARLEVTKRAEVEQEYAARSKIHPGDSALLYLLGRVAPDEPTALRRYREAIEADEENAYAWFGRAVRLFRRGDLDEAQRHAERAAKLRPRDAEMARVLLQVRFARGDLEPARATLEAWTQKRPTDLGLQRELLEVLSAADELSTARDRHQRFRTELAQRTDAQQRALLSELALLYLEGKYAELLSRAAALNDLRRRARVELEALVELDRLGEAEQRLAAAADPDAELVLALAWSLKGDAERSRARRAAAKAALAKGDAGSRAAAELVERRDVRIARILPLAIPPARKALLLLLVTPTSVSAQAAELAERFNYGRLFPRDFLSRAIAHRRGS